MEEKICLPLAPFKDFVAQHHCCDGYNLVPNPSKSFEEALISVWRQSLIDKSAFVTLDDRQFPVRTTAKRKLKQIDFVFEGRDIRGLEQNPETKSRWAKMAREGKKVMQFLENGRYVVVVVDGKLKFYR